MGEESDRKTALAKEFRKLGHYGRRIEDKYGVGFPDLILGIKGYPIFICEAKIVRTSTYFAPTERQYVELGRLSLSPKHVVPCLLGFDDGELYLHTPTKRAILSECVKKRDDETVIEFFKRFYHEKAEV